MAVASPAAEGPPPPRDVPTAKEKKYDRQLRLWGAPGQRALEESHILLINSGPGVAGIEALKNVVLPGVGHFTVLDSALVCEADLGVNFFLEQSSLGKFRAEETAKYLTELNPDVRGSSITDPLETWAVQDDIFAPYTLVLIAAPVGPAVAEILARQLQASGTPACYFHSLGYYGHFSLSLPPAFPIVDTHPDPTAATDLRLMAPWPELLQFARNQTANMSKMKEDEFAHIPYLCLLLHYLDQWQAEHGKLPETYKEKTAFRDLVRSGHPTEENFDEACAAVLKTLHPPTAPSSVREILSAPEASHLSAASSPFWIIANAVHQFHTKHGQLPLPGAVPDMKARSETYIELQNIYKRKARRDVAEVVTSVRALEAQVGRSPELAIPEAVVENFCRGAAHISLVRGRPLRIPHAGATMSFGDRAKSLCTDLTAPDSLVALYIAFSAWDLFAARDGANAPSETPPRAAGREHYEEDRAELVGIAHTLVDALIDEAGAHIPEPEYSTVRASVATYAHELARAGGGELHNIAALTGGLIAQELIKLITRQYVPVDNTCLFDGVASRTWVARI